MQQARSNKRYFPKKALLILVLLVSIVAAAVSGTARKANDANEAGDKEPAPVKDSAASVAAFREVYKVLMSPRCMNCHQPGNTPGLRTPPGNPKWALPPADMRMVFQNKSAHDLALQIMDYSRNGHKNKEQLIEHARDTLVKWGWNPGEGRSLPPLNYQEFVKAWDTWINNGGYAPPKS